MLPNKLINTIMTKHSMCALGNALYIFGSSETLKLENPTLMMNSEKWRTIPHPKFVFFYNSAMTVIAEDKILILGNKCRNNFVYEFDISTEKFT